MVRELGVSRVGRLAGAGSGRRRLEAQHWGGAFLPCARCAHPLPQTPHPAQSPSNRAPKPASGCAPARTRVAVVGGEAAKGWLAEQVANAQRIHLGPAQAARGVPQPSSGRRRRRQAQNLLQAQAGASCGPAVGRLGEERGRRRQAQAGSAHEAPPAGAGRWQGAAREFRAAMRGVAAPP